MWKFFKHHTHAFDSIVVAAFSLITFCSAAVAQQSSVSEGEQLIELVAEGVGRDDNEAMKNALSNAVRQAIGVVVSADSLVENDQLVRDRILTYSDGYVEKVTRIGTVSKTESGLTTITIRAVIRGTKLIEKARVENISVASVDGLTLYSQAVTQREQRLSQKGQLSLDMEGIPSSLVRAAAKTTDITYNEKSERATVPVDIWVDRDAYNAFVSRLTDKLKSLGVQEVTLIPSEHKKRITRDDRKRIDKEYRDLGQSGDELDRSKETYLMRHGYLSEIRFPEEQFPNEIQKSPSQTIWICTRMDQAMQSSKWSLFQLSKELIDSFSAIHSIVVNIELRDATGATLRSHAISIGTFRRGGITGPPVCHSAHIYNQDPTPIIVHPLIAARYVEVSKYFSGYMMGFDDGWSVDRKMLQFTLSPVEMKKVVKIVCTIEPGASVASK